MDINPTVVHIQQPQTQGAAGTQQVTQEQIIIEAQCNKSAVFVEVLLEILISSITIVSIPVLIMVAYFEVQKWRLYLTPTYIHYHGLNLDVFGDTTVVIYLRDIHEIRSEGQNSAIIKMDRRKYMEMTNQPFSCYNVETNSCCGSFKLSNEIDVPLRYIMDAPRFVETVKMQVAANK